MFKAKPELMSQAEFARRHGVSKMTVARWRRRGAIVCVGGMVDPRESERMLAERPQTYRGGVARGLFVGGKR